PIYGEYSSTLGQHQMESQYTDWRSRKLYCPFEEIFSRDQKYSHTGTVKQMITGATQRIEKKFVSGWEEANHMNAVFLSNEIQPFPVEPSDRRMFVIWPKTKLEKSHVYEIIDKDDCVLNGVCEAWFHFLLNYDVGDFRAHTEPPETNEKQRLIDFGRPSWDTFYLMWQRGALEVPFMTCLSTDLYVLYKSWCKLNGEHSVSHTRFGGFIAVRMRRRSDIEYEVGQGSKKGTFLFTESVPKGVKQVAYLGQKVRDFNIKLSAIQQQVGDNE
ncbi:MAG: DNA primase, partial [Gammaproteobacteria bacterium]|nr:DNA primase [Gammaproteobacteria bacterium]